jgi:hypothetical protein
LGNGEAQGHEGVIQSSGHGLHTLAFAWQQQRRAVALQRNVPVNMLCGFSQALDICRKASLQWAWRDVFAHRTGRSSPLKSTAILSNTAVRVHMAEVFAARLSF